MTRRVPSTSAAVVLRALGALAATFALMAAPPAARGDVVKLTNGRTVTGTVVSESDAAVVVRTPEGTVTLPRALVASIERQSRGETLLALALERARAGDDEEAARLFEQATQDPDPEVARRARTAYDAFRAQQERAARFRTPPHTSLPLPPGTRGEPVEAGTLQEQLDRARRALETGDAPYALRLLEPMAADNPDDRVLRYLLGRAYELAGRRDRAVDAYRFVLGPRFYRDGREAAWLGELARRACCGEPVADPDWPGAGPAWRRVETPHFALYHPFEEVPPWYATVPEVALQDVLERLGVQLRELPWHGRIQVFMFETRDAYLSFSGGALRNAAAHAQYLDAPDGRLKMIIGYPDRNFYESTYRHEIAHTAIFDLYTRFPTWAHEGAASYAQPPRMRAYLRSLAAARRANGRLTPTLEFLAAERPTAADVGDVRAFYAQAYVTFEALASLVGSTRRTLDLCARIADQGPEAALRNALVPVDRLDAEIARILTTAATGQ